MTAPEEKWEEWGSERMFRAIHDKVALLSHQGGVKVLNCDDEIVLKVGSRVRPSEEIAMRLVKEHTDIPVPEILLAAYVGDEGRLAMSVIPGAPLTEAWDSLDDATKKRICVETWSMIEKLRRIEKPAALQHHFLSLADGSPCINDPVVAGLCCADPPHPPLLDDDAVRARIMDLTAPTKYDLSGIMAARGVLF
ncbi:predicted protein [Uncinocarpus reesii 1704]|uniref:Aminoglycoside phosphotransferase domain-containing protein n=1 Tax=Uncinocarpus reesii (strain UAMH 1704) TaxID=336963 RepID=C4JIT6_UNCRE|nr:uncharacterized protein UREG_02947 [Uncinocarpus reesii 1704]EEP78098.1 predicted protein [Uncinocarpus reesii 1704]